MEMFGSASECTKFVCLMVFNAIFNNISVMSWRSVLLVQETVVPGENHRPGGDSAFTFINMLDYGDRRTDCERCTCAMLGSPPSLKSRPWRSQTFNNIETGVRGGVREPLQVSNSKGVCRIDNSFIVNELSYSIMKTEKDIHDKRNII